MFRPKISRAGSVRIGEPPTKGRNYPKKIDHFQFTLPVKDGKYYPKDEHMHEIYGPEPKYIGPIFLISDNLQECLNMQLAMWGSNKIKSRRKCFKMLNPFGGGNVDDGLPASQLYKSPEGLAYRDRVCLNSECPDFIKKKGGCSPSLCIKFWMPNSPRLGEYWLAAGSYHAINAMFGFIEMMRRGLQEDHENNSLIGLSKIPLALVLKQDSVRYEGKDTVVYYPELTLDRKLIEVTRSQGVFNALPTLVGNDGKNLLTAGKATRRFQQEEAEAAVISSDASGLADDGEIVEAFEAISTPAAPIDESIIDVEVHEAHASEETEVEVPSPVKQPMVEAEVKTDDAKTVPKPAKTSEPAPEKSAEEEKKVLDTTPKEEYNNRASSDDQTMSAEEVELLEAQLEEMGEGSHLPPVIEEAQGTPLAQLLVEEQVAEAPAESANEAGGFVLFYQHVDGGGTEKREEAIARIPEGFEQVSPSCDSIFFKTDNDSDKNSVQFIVRTDDEVANEIKDGFMSSPWSVGKLRFQITSKGIDKTHGRMKKYITKE